jgi:hypothetical protein
VPQSDPKITFNSQYQGDTSTADSLVLVSSEYHLDLLDCVGFWEPGPEKGFLKAQNEQALYLKKADKPTKPSSLWSQYPIGWLCDASASLIVP